MLKRNLDGLSLHPVSEKLVNVLCQKTQSNNKLFFRILVAYYFAKLASMMRCSIDTKDRGLIPVNMYAVNLALSGQGKGHSTNIIEEHVIAKFKKRFLDSTFEIRAAENIRLLAQTRAAKNNTNWETEEEALMNEFKRTGPMAFNFDSGTGPAVKQLRHKLLIADAGSLNLEMDEIGANILGNTEVITSYLELYDIGKIKQKLIKNTNENQRTEDIDGRTPTNMMLFGTPTKLFNGGKTEEEFMSLLDQGYARRCFFGYSRTPSRDSGLSAKEVYKIMTDNSTNGFLQTLSNDLCDLADVSNFGQELEISEDTTIEAIEYKLYCEKLAEKLPDHQEIAKAELQHRFFKAMKLAGTYAFIDGSSQVTEDHLYYAIALTEESGEAFTKLLNRDRNYARLAHYIASVGTQVTHVDLVEDLPFYTGSATARNELLNLAIAYGHSHNIIIKRDITDNIEFLSGETLEETDLSKLCISYGTEMAANYDNQYAPFDQLHKLTQKNGYHWVAHHLKDGYRNEENALPGCNMIVLDIDHGTPIETAKLLLKDYTYHMYTTKRHTSANNRYRILLPMSHVLRFKTAEYKHFMQNVAEWLPFEVDEQTFQRSRKWESFDGEYFYNEAELIDVLLFIPKTRKCDDTKKVIKDLHSLNNLERWFVKNIAEGDRNNQMLRYALILVDSGFDGEEIRNKLLSLNNKLDNKLEETEILSTVMVTVTQKLHEKSVKEAQE